MVLRLAFRIDARLLVAAMGAAAAMLLPVAAVLVVGGLEPEVEADDLLGVPPPGTPISGLLDGATGAVAVWTVDGSLVAADLMDPGVPTDAMRPMPLAGQQAPIPGLDVRARARTTGMLPADAWEVHPDLVPDDATLHAVRLPTDEAPHGWLVGPARGNDAFEVAGTKDVRQSTTFLIVASLPAVAVVAAVFAGQEAHAFRRNAATLTALGRPRLARGLLIGRSAWMVMLATLMAGGAGLALAAFGTGGPPAASWQLTAALLLPAGVALLVAATRASMGLGGALQLLRSPAAMQVASGPATPWLPVILRPLVSGWRVVPFLALAALLFVADVGVPLAGASIPASIAGGNDEWVLGGQPGDRPQVARADVLGLHEDVDAIVAEVIQPTMVAGVAAVVRGGHWDAVRSYHGARLVEGDAPGAGGIVLGEGLARRLGAGLGDTLPVQHGNPGVSYLTVQGILRAPDLLHDEAVVTLARGQAIAGLRDGEATVVRARPASPAALAALTSDDADVRVTELALDPPDPAAGTRAIVVAHVVNVGGHGGSRDLTLRIDGEAVASRTARVAGFATVDVAMPFLVPAGDFRIDVNPTLAASGTGTPGNIAGPPIAFPGDTLSITWTRDDAGVAGDVSLVAADGLPVATVSTASDGVGELVAPGPGRYTLEAPGAATDLLLGRSEDKNTSRADVRYAWSDPPAPRQDSPMSLHVTFQNVGGMAGPADVEVLLGTIRIHQWNESLAPGETASRTLTFTPRDARVLHVDDFQIPVESARSGREVKGPRQPPSDDGIVNGATAQAQVADRVLGDAAQVLGGIAAAAIGSTMAVVYLATDRILRGRAQVLATLATLAGGAAYVRRRAAIEAACLGAAVSLLAVLVAKLALAGARLAGVPVVFGHVLPDPFTWLLSLQVMAAFAGTAALAAFAASGPAMEGATPMGRTRSRDDPLPDASLSDLLEGQPGA